MSDGTRMLFFSPNMLAVRGEVTGCCVEVLEVKNVGINENLKPLLIPILCNVFLLKKCMTSLFLRRFSVQVFVMIGSNTTIVTWEAIR